MKKELKHFYIGNSYGGNQQWFKGFFMKLGGCAAETACDICIYLDLYKNTALYPCEKDNIKKSDYISFADKMKPYLHPRMGGIDRLSIYTEGFGKYIKSAGESMDLISLEGNQSYEVARQFLISQINEGYPIAFLCLKHQNKAFRDYKWHWFLLNGYEIKNEKVFVKAVTYSEAEWLDFEELWNSGYPQKGGMVSVEKKNLRGGIIQKAGQVLIICNV